MNFDTFKDVRLQLPESDGDYECFHKFLGLIPVKYKKGKWYSNGVIFPVIYYR